MNWLELISGLIGGSTAQYLVSSKFITKKEKRDADEKFIEQLLERVQLLELRLEENTKVVKDLLVENARMKAELEFLKRGSL
jgi:hypothetical protein